MAPFQKKRSLMIVLMAGVLLLAIVAAGCTGSNTPQTTPAMTPAASGTSAVQPTTETLTLSGSTTVLPIAQAVADAYMKAHPEANIQVSGGGSGVGIQAIINQKVDIGMSSADVTAAQKSQDPSMNIITIAHDGIAIIVNPANTIPDISLPQVQQIYSGNITSWSSINGAGVPSSNNQIVLVGRDSSSGTRTYFDSFVMKGVNDSMSMHEDNSNGAVAQEVAQTPLAIGYVSIGFLSSSVKAVPILMPDGSTIAPNVDTVKNETYPIHRDLYMITNGQPTGLAKDYLDFLLSPDGQQIVVQQGYVALTS